MEGLHLKTKHVLGLLLALAVLLSGTPVLAAETALRITLDGTLLPENTGAYVDENGRSMVSCTTLKDCFSLTAEATPVRVQAVSFFETADSTSGVLLMDCDSTLYACSRTADGVVSGSAILIMDTTPVVKNGTLYVPLRYVLEQFGYTIGWDSAARAVSVTSPRSALSFDFELLSQMPKDQNYMISPLSLKIALAMAANGAAGETRQEILDALDITDLEQFNREIQKLIQRYSSNGTVQLSIANSIWYNTDFYSNDSGFSRDFSSVMESYYYGKAETITNATGSQRVNDWIAGQTKDKIQDVVTDDVISETLSLLVNTIYFNGDWQIPFAAELTADSTFTDRAGMEQTTAFMNHTGNYLYYENDSFQMLAKPYEDQDLQLYVILPKGDEALTQALFDEAVEKMEHARVWFSVPKFKTEYLHDDLIRILKQFGIKAAFDPASADFSGMFYGIDPDMPIVINGILQKTFIQVDEAGTEAAAATVIGIGMTSAQPDPIAFLCNRPFLYLIRDDSTGTILFMGEYAFVK